MTNFIGTGKSQFFFAVDQACLSGTILAHYLAKSDFAKNRAVSLLGFSLGGVVTFNCLKILKRVHDHIDPRVCQILNDVNIWAGCYVIDLTKKYDELKEKSQNCIVINGNLNNMYSKKDGALKMFKQMLYPGENAIGTYPIFTEIEEKDKEVCKLAVNYNFTEEAPGHSTYSQNCGNFMFKVKDAY